MLGFQNDIAHIEARVHRTKKGTFLTTRLKGVSFEDKEGKDRQEILRDLFRSEMHGTGNTLVLKALVGRSMEVTAEVAGSAYSLGYVNRHVKGAILEAIGGDNRKLGEEVKIASHEFRIHKIEDESTKYGMSISLRMNLNDEQYEKLLKNLTKIGKVGIDGEIKEGSKGQD